MSLWCLVRRLSLSTWSRILCPKQLKPRLAELLPQVARLRHQNHQFLMRSPIRPFRTISKWVTMVWTRNLLPSYSVVDLQRQDLSMSNHSKGSNRITSGIHKFSRSRSRSSSRDSRIVLKRCLVRKTTMMISLKLLTSLMITIRLTSIKKQPTLIRVAPVNIIIISRVTQMKCFLHNLVTIIPNSIIRQRQTMTQYRMLRLSNKVWWIVNLRCPISSLIRLQMLVKVAIPLNQTLKKRCSCNKDNNNRMLLR